MPRGKTATQRAGEVLEKLDELRAEWDAKAKKEHPEMTAEQLEASWQQARHQLGL